MMFFPPLDLGHKFIKMNLFPGLLFRESPLLEIERIANSMFTFFPGCDKDRAGSYFDPPRQDELGKIVPLCYYLYEFENSWGETSFR